MQPQMSPIDSSDNLFHDGNPLTGIKGTIVTAEWLNAVQASTRDIQAELIAILTASALAPDDTAGQLLAAIRKLTMSRTNPGADLVTDGSVSTFLQNLGLGDSDGYVGRMIAKTKITSSASFSWNTLTKKIRVRIVGAGAAGGGGTSTASDTCIACAGGGSGAYVEAWFNVADLSGPIAVVIGSGGTYAYGSGGDGGASSFGSYISCPGGGGGNSVGGSTATTYFMSAQGGGASSPTVTGADTIVTAMKGRPAMAGIVYGGNVFPGFGASSPFGSGDNNSSSGAGGSGDGYGAGGTGAGIPASTAQLYGGTGADGVCIIEEYA